MGNAGLNFFSGPTVTHLPALAAAGLLVVAAASFGIADNSGEAPEFLLGDISLEVTCSQGECPVRIRLTREDGAALSAALPFAALTDEIAQGEATEAFMLELPGADAGAIQNGAKPRDLVTWYVGEETRDVGVAVEIVPTGLGTQALLVHQIAGFEHLKRAHVVLVPASDGLAEVLRRVEGVGAEVLSVASQPGGVLIRRTLADGTIEEERLVWREADGAPALVSGQ